MGSVQQSYLEKVGTGELQSDPVQVELAARLDTLIERLAKKSLSKKSSSLGWLFAKSAKVEPIIGLYIWGSVGRGKSMLMDLFYSLLVNKAKRRVHFHEFMADVQDRIYQHRQDYKEGKTKEEDPIPPVARALAVDATVLCFDEFAVTDIADAMILSRVFKELFKAGTVVIATSNVAPDNLYKDGLNRALFLPFIDLLKENIEVYELDARTDYRLEKLSNAPVYLAPLGKKAKLAFENQWEGMTAGLDIKSGAIKRKGREIIVPICAEGVARFTFADLCDAPLAAADYLAIAEKYHTFFIQNVPIMNASVRNQAKRFILLIDALYDQNKRLIISAEANPHALYQGATGTEAFEFQRTASRLIEMQSTEYLEAIAENI